MPKQPQRRRERSDSQSPWRICSRTQPNGVSGCGGSIRGCPCTSARQRLTRRTKRIRWKVWSSCLLLEPRNLSSTLAQGTLKRAESELDSTPKVSNKTRCLRLIPTRTQSFRSADEWRYHRKSERPPALPLSWACSQSLRLYHVAFGLTSFLHDSSQQHRHIVSIQRSLEPHCHDDDGGHRFQDAF